MAVITSSNVCSVKKISIRSNTKQCGIGHFRPRWLQKLANKFVFIFLFALMIFFQKAYYDYLRGIVSTLERQLSAETKLITSVFVSKELSQVLCGLVLAYYGGQGNRPRWIAWGLLISCVGCLVIASPVLLYVGQPIHVKDYEEYKKSMCVAPSKLVNEWSNNVSTNSSHQWTNDSSFDMISQTIKLNRLDEDDPCNDESSYDSVTGLLVMIAGAFLAGAGFTIVLTLAYPYLDDSVTKSASALYIAFVLGMEVAGSTFASMLAGVCLRFYVTLTSHPGITDEDPKWIGAWWLGIVIIGAAFGIGALVVVFFPRQLVEDEPKVTVKTVDGDMSTNAATLQCPKTERERPQIKGFLKAMTRLLKNKILICHSLARCLVAFGTNGFYTFQSKYVETQFRKTASEANLFTGITGNAMRFVGILITGIVYRFWKPKSVYVNGWNVILNLFFIASMVGLMQLGCPTVSIIGTEQNVAKHSTVGATVAGCQSNCSCSHVGFSPVCLNNQNYFSACHAGCQNYVGKQTNRHIYGNCSCGLQTGDENFNLTTEPNSSLPLDDDGQTGMSGFCPFECSSFTLYLIISGIQKTLMSTKKVGRLLIILRCIDEKDKSIALALHTLMESLIAYIPSPIVYGALMDAACVMWGNICGKLGNCWLYNSEYLRYALHGTTICATACGALLDAYVLFLCRKLSLFEDETEVATTTNKKNDDEPKEKRKDDGLNTSNRVEI